MADQKVEHPSALKQNPSVPSKGQIESKRELKTVVTVILLPHVCGTLVMADKSGKQFAFYYNAPREMEEAKAKELVAIRKAQCDSQKRDCDLVIIEN